VRPIVPEAAPGGPDSTDPPYEGLWPSTGGQPVPFSWVDGPGNWYVLCLQGRNFGCTACHRSAHELVLQRSCVLVPGLTRLRRLPPPTR